MFKFDLTKFKNQKKILRKFLINRNFKTSKWELTEKKIKETNNKVFKIKILGLINTFLSI